MALTLRKKPSKTAGAPKPAPPPRRKPINQTAAVATFRFEDTGWKDWKFGSVAWQVEGFRHYDRGGELHSVANAVANMVSRSRIFIAKKTDEGEPGEAATEPKIVELQKQIYGGAEERPENLRLAGVNLFLTGEQFTFIETPPKAKPDTPDRWMVFSVTQIKKAGGDPKLTFERPHRHGGGTIAYWIPEGKDVAKDKRRAAENTGILLRCWTQHAQLPDHPDSSVRAVIPVLNLIEQYDKRASAQNDSRLAGAGVMFLPDSFDFPHGDNETPTDAFEVRIGEAMGTTLKDPGNARSLVPIMATVGGDDIEKVKWMTFETALDEQTPARLDQCIRRLALGLDIPPEMLLGIGGMNHWSAWQAEASTHKTFVAPLLARLCNSLTEGWLQPILEQMGGVDPADYMVWFDMSPLTVRPDRQADALALWDRGLINDDAVLDAGNWPESAKHTPESFKRWLIVKTILANPALISDPTFGTVVGITAAAPAGGQPALGAAGAAPPALESGAAGEQPPAQPTSTRSPAQEALVAGAEMAALHSLAVAGKKMLTRGVRDQLMHEFAGRPYDLHTRLNVNDQAHAEQLLDGTWDLLPQLAARTGTHPTILRDILSFYCSGQMVAGSAHNPDMLTFYLSEGILAAGHRFCGDSDVCLNQLNPNPCVKALVPA